MHGHMNSYAYGYLCIPYVFPTGAQGGGAKGEMLCSRICSLTANGAFTVITRASLLAMGACRKGLPACRKGRSKTYIVYVELCSAIRVANKTGGRLIRRPEGPAVRAHIYTKLFVVRFADSQTNSKPTGQGRPSLPRSTV